MPSSYIRRLTNRDPYAVYALFDNESQEVVYIGLTSNPTRRAAQHNCTKRNLSLKVLAILQGFAEASRVESALIQYYKDEGCDLLNEALSGGTCAPSKLPLEALMKVRTTAENRKRHVETQRMIRQGARMAEVFK